MKEKGGIPVKLKRILVWAILLVIFCSICTPALAASYEDAIYDAADLFADAEKEQIQAAIDSIADTVGAEVHVITVRSIGNYPEMDKFLEAVEADTPSWQTQTGMRKSSLLVFAMSLEDRKLCIYWGEAWVDALEGSRKEADRIREQIMVPEFRAGDFANGFVRAIEETERVLDLYLRPPAVQPQPAPQPRNITNHEPDTPKEPMNPALKWFLILLVPGIVVVIGLVVSLRALIRWRRKRKEKRRRAQTEALTKHGNTTELLHGLVKLNAFERGSARLKSKVSKYSAIDPGQKQALESWLSTFDNLLASATEIMNSTEDPISGRLPFEAYEQIARNCHDADGKVLRAQYAAEEIDAICTGLDDEIKAIDDTIAKRTAMLARISEKIRNAKDTNRKLPREIDGFASIVADVKSETSDTTIPYARSVKSTITQLYTIEEVIDEMNKKVSRLDSEIPTLDEEILGLKKVLAEVRAAELSDLKDHYAPSSWVDVSKNDLEAEQAIKEAAAELQKAKDIYLQDDYDRALKAIDKVIYNLQEVAFLLNDVVIQRDKLIDSRQSFPGRLRSAEGNIESAEDYIQKNIADLNDSNRSMYRDWITKARRNITEAQAANSQELPDYMISAELLAQANDLALKTLAACKDVVRKAESERRRAKDALDKARKELREVREYIDRHSGDIGYSAKSMLDDAEHKLKRANGLSMVDVAAIMLIVNAVNTSSAQAMSSAKRAVRDADSERQRQTALLNNSYNSGGSSFGSFGGSGGLGGGGSSTGGW